MTTPYRDPEDGGELALFVVVVLVVICVAVGWAALS